MDAHFDALDAVLDPPPLSATSTSALSTAAIVSTSAFSCRETWSWASVTA